MYSFLRPLLFSLPSETAHTLALNALRAGLVPPSRLKPAPQLAQTCFGLDFPNPVGIAAGFDKNANAIEPLLRAGFGFVEVGTVTPEPQPGNPRPRLFRLVEDEAVINRLGFNNGGLLPFTSRLKMHNPSLGIVGANIGKNKLSEDAVSDYVRGLRAVYAHAHYITINISSPNTQGLRALQERDALNTLLDALCHERTLLKTEQRIHRPLLLKIAPDLDENEITALCDVVLAHAIDGLIVSNTTLARPASLRSVHHSESGGLSGKPLMARSTETLKICYRKLGKHMPIIGVGGIASAEDAYAKIRAGASLVQLYTALIYQGFGLVDDIKQGLVTLLKRDGFSHLNDAIGQDA